MKKFYRGSSAPATFLSGHKKIACKNPFGLRRKIVFNRNNLAEVAA